MRRILLISLAILLAALSVVGVRYELKKRARQRREEAYQAAWFFYWQTLKPGMNRKEVEDYLRHNNLAFIQTCCIDMKESKKGSLDDLVQIGQEDAPWFCRSLIVYVGFQFTGPGNFDGIWRPDDADKLKVVTLHRAYDKCL